MPSLFCLKLEYLSVCYTVDFHDSSTHPHHLTIRVLFSWGRFTTGSQLLPQEGLKSLDGFFALFSSFPIRSILHGRVSVTACSPNQKSLNAYSMSSEHWAETGLSNDRQSEWFRNTDVELFHPFESNRPRSQLLAIRCLLQFSIFCSSPALSHVVN